MKNATETTTEGIEADARTIAQLCRTAHQAKSFTDIGDGIYMELGRGRKVIVKLNVWDTYDVEVGRINMRTLEWKISDQVFGISCDRLEEAVASRIQTSNATKARSIDKQWRRRPSSTFWKPLRNPAGRHPRDARNNPPTTRGQRNTAETSGRPLHRAVDSSSNVGS